MDRFWVIIVDMSVKAFEPQAFERAVIGALLLEMKRQNMSRRTLAERAGISKSRAISTTPHLSLQLQRIAPTAGT